MKNTINPLLLNQHGDIKIFYFLKAIPHFKNCSSTIINKISKRLGLTPEHLAILIDFVSKEGGLYGN